MRSKLYTHPLPLLLGYLCFYLLGFVLLERWDRAYHIISCRLDSFVPFVPAAVIPYLLWFVWIPCAFLWFYKRCREIFWRLFLAVALGNTAALGIFAVYPTVQLRRRTLYGTDLFTSLIRLIYQSDTPTNVCPSLHVSISVTAMLAVLLGGAAMSRRARLFHVILGTAICLSTVLIRQHSCVDVFWGVVLGCASYAVAGKLLYGRCGPPLPHRFKRRLRRC